MLRSLFCLPAIVLALSFVTNARGDEAADELKKLEGDWTPTAMTMNGKDVSEKLIRLFRLTIKEDKYKVISGEQVDEGTLILDPSKKPREMDVVGTSGPNSGKTFVAIYEMAKGELRICYGLDGMNRPTEFKSEEGGKGLTLLAIYKKREKARDKK